MVPFIKWSPCDLRNLRQEKIYTQGFQKRRIFYQSWFFNLYTVENKFFFHSLLQQTSLKQFHTKQILPEHLAPGMYYIHAGYWFSPNFLYNTFWNKFTTIQSRKYVSKSSILRLVGEKIKCLITTLASTYLRQDKIRICNCSFSKIHRSDWKWKTL